MEFHFGGIWARTQHLWLAFPLCAPDNSSQAVLNMKVTAIKGLFFMFAMLGVALQGCGGCNEDAMNSCSIDVATDLYANKIAACAGAEASLKCHPDHGCCDLEVTPGRWRSIRLRPFHCRYYAT